MKFTHHVFFYSCSWLIPLGAPATIKTGVMFDSSAVFVSVGGCELQTVKGKSFSFAVSRKCKLREL